MAAVLETITVPRASAALLFPISASSVSVRRNSVRFADFRRSKIQHSRSSSSLASISRLSSSGRRIVCEAQKVATEVPPVSDATWKSLVLDSDVPVLVEFWAPWCGPCRMIHPVIDELAKEFAGKLKCYKVNTDDSPAIATKYGIRSIPTVMIFKNGEKKDAVIGAVPKSTLCTCIEKFC
ncbi:unnamed protein product [Cuscuta campestris]|uniref:Thioredoxin domain-containing protein n=2 Tax=Cuscuta sect. Cleistogrammica TaxID=1824901 RepID=A0A484L9V7_9ASTE|nr:hypothetical protein DM860_014871 [Cuscuta australis]VFQ72996.1 unnamed protein product [Cuscuta campestris]VFQ90335.1 unnamed protein product [Cuscuta campestris]VFQ90338.1 unnamed protein product [Cuscuta campestris]